MIEGFLFISINMICSGDESYIMVMERRRHMIDLFEASQKYGIFCESFCRSVLRQVIKATQHCIKVGILHRDIKDENVLVDLKTGEVNFQKYFHFSWKYI